MRIKDFHECLGILFVEGNFDLIRTIGRSPLQNIPKPIRPELPEYRKAEKRHREKNKYHFMGNTEKKKRIKEINEKRDERNKTRAILEMCSLE